MASFYVLVRCGYLVRGEAMNVAVLAWEDPNTAGLDTPVYQKSLKTLVEWEHVMRAFPRYVTEEVRVDVMTRLAKIETFRDYVATLGKVGPYTPFEFTDERPSTASAQETLESMWKFFFEEVARREHVFKAEADPVTVIVDDLRQEADKWNRLSMVRGTGDDLRVRYLKLHEELRRLANKYERGLDLRVVHASDWAQQPDVQIRCDKSWTAPVFNAPKSTRAGVHEAEDGRLYTFDETRVTCPACKGAPKHG